MLFHVDPRISDQQEAAQRPRERQSFPERSWRNSKMGDDWCGLIRYNWMLIGVLEVKSLER